MSEPKKIRWLYDELPALIENGVVNQEIAAKIKEYYGTPIEKSKYSLALIIAGILGSVLIGGGIILIFAYNWENMSKFWRTFFSYSPLVIAQIIYTYVFFRKKSDPAWVEASSAFLMLMLAATIALISQTYHIGGDLEDFIFSWMALSIPLLYLMNSRMVGLIYLIGISSFVWNSYNDGYWYWGFLLIALPYFYKQVWQNKSSNGSLWLTWLLSGSFLIAYWGTVNMNVAEYGVLGNALILSIFYLLGNQYYSGGKNILWVPLQTIAAIGIFLLGMMLTYEWPNDAFNWSRILDLESNQVKGIINFLILIVLLLSYLILLYFHTKKGSNLNYLFVFFPLILLAGIVICRIGYPSIAKIIANVFLLILSLTYLKAGIRNKSMTTINKGIGIIAILIIARFFDIDLPIIIKGIVFVILGLAFLGANFILSRKLKAED